MLEVSFLEDDNPADLVQSMASQLTAGSDATADVLGRLRTGEDLDKVARSYTSTHPRKRHDKMGTRGGLGDNGDDDEEEEEEEGGSAAHEGRMYANTGVGERRSTPGRRRGRHPYRKEGGDDETPSSLDKKREAARKRGHMQNGGGGDGDSGSETELAAAMYLAKADAADKPTALASMFVQLKETGADDGERAEAICDQHLAAASEEARAELVNCFVDHVADAYGKWKASGMPRKSAHPAAALFPKLASCETRGKDIKKVLATGDAGSEWFDYDDTVSIVGFDTKTHDGRRRDDDDDKNGRGQRHSTYANGYSGCREKPMRKGGDDDDDDDERRERMRAYARLPEEARLDVGVALFAGLAAFEGKPLPKGSHAMIRAMNEAETAEDAKEIAAKHMAELSVSSRTALCNCCKRLAGVASLDHFAKALPDTEGKWKEWKEKARKKWREFKEARKRRNRGEQSEGKDDDDDETSARDPAMAFALLQSIAAPHVTSDERALEALANGDFESAAVGERPTGARAQAIRAAARHALHALRSAQAPFNDLDVCFAKNRVTSEHYASACDSHALYDMLTGMPGQGGGGGGGGGDVKELAEALKGLQKHEDACHAAWAVIFKLYRGKRLSIVQLGCHLHNIVSVFDKGKKNVEEQACQRVLGHDDNIERVVEAFARIIQQDKDQHADAQKFKRIGEKLKRALRGDDRGYDVVCHIHSFLMRENNIF